MGQRLELITFADVCFYATHRLQRAGWCLVVFDSVLSIEVIQTNKQTLIIAFVRITTINAVD